MTDHRHVNVRPRCQLAEPLNDPILFQKAIVAVVEAHAQHELQIVDDHVLNSTTRDHPLYFVEQKVRIRSAVVIQERQRQLLELIPGEVESFGEFRMRMVEVRSRELPQHHRRQPPVRHFEAAPQSADALHAQIQRIFGEERGLAGARMAGEQSQFALAESFQASGQRRESFPLQKKIRIWQKNFFFRFNLIPKFRPPPHPTPAPLFDSI